MNTTATRGYWTIAALNQYGTAVDEVTYGLIDTPANLDVDLYGIARNIGELAGPVENAYGMHGHGIAYTFTIADSADEDTEFLAWWTWSTTPADKLKASYLAGQAPSVSVSIHNPTVRNLQVIGGSEYPVPFVAVTLPNRECLYWGTVEQAREFIADLSIRLAHAEAQEVNQ